MRATRPLFRFDPGWLFIIAGLAVCAAGVLLPAQADLRALDDQLAQLQAEEARAYQRLAAHADFIDQVDRSEPAIIKRLAAAQLNLVPEGDKPVLLVGSNVVPVTQWIDGTLRTDLRPTRPEPVSTLSRWANGQSRLWMFGGGIMAVFIGLLISPEGSRRARRAVPVMAAAGGAYSVSASSLVRHGLLDDADEDAQLDALLAADAQDDECIDALLQSLPATADVDELRDLAQLEDTVDLEEDELPARKRTIIDDDASWHAAATVEHASEVIIEAKEVSPAQHDGLLWEDDEISEPPYIAPMATAESDEADGQHDSTENVPWSIDDDARLFTSSMLLPKSPDAEEDAAVDDDFPTTATPLTKPGKRTAPKRTNKPQKKPERRVVEGKGDDLVEGDRRVARGGKSMPFNQKSDRKPPRKVRDDDGSAASIPFLRYRPNEDDAEDEDADEALEVELAEDEMPSMEADDSDATMVAEADDDAAEAENDEDADEDEGRSMKFRRR